MSFPVLFMTKEVAGREDVAVRAIRSLRNHLYMGDDPVFYVADGGSSMPYLDALSHEISKFGKMKLTSIPDVGAGTVWNAAIHQIFDDGHEFYFRLEDDFLLKNPADPFWTEFNRRFGPRGDKIIEDHHLPIPGTQWDITHYIEILIKNNNIGMIRLGLMPIDLNCYTVGIDGEIFFALDSSTQYAYSGNPGLVHKRLHDNIGFFDQEKTPGEIEVDFDARYRQHKSLSIIWPLLVGVWGTYGAWEHIGNVQSY